MSAPESTHQFRWPLAVPLAIFLAAVLGVPVYEAIQENVPGVGVLESATWAEFTDGRLARRIETGFAERLEAAAVVRPRYQEALWLLLRRATPKVVVGKEGWLFEASNVLGGPRRDAAAAVEEHARLIGGLSRWLESKGIALLAVPVPNKWAVHPEKLPDLPAPPQSVWRGLVRSLEGEGVWTADLAAALDPSGSAPFLREDAGSAGDSPAFRPAALPPFLANDTHWSEAGCAASAAAVAGRIRSRFDAEIPGAPLDACLEPIPGHLHRGDLQRMLGFAEGSAVDRRFLVETTRFVAWERRTRRRVENPPPGQDVVCCGTSFSHSMGFTAKLSVALGRRVEDLTVSGRGPTVMLLDLADAVREGRRPAPKLVVWEFPEKHVFERRADFLEPLRSFGDRAWRAEAWAQRTWSPLALASREPVNLRIRELDGGAVSGTPTTGDPQLIVCPGVSLPAGTGLWLGYTVRTRRPTTTKVLFDYGDGFDRSRAVIVPVGGGLESKRVLVPIDGPPGGEVRRFRLDPVDASEDFELGPLQLSSG